MLSPTDGRPRQRRTLALDLVQAIEQRVREGVYAAGEKLPTEAAIMAEFGVSRTVVREAISKLQTSGLVQTRHGIGTFVRDTLGAAPFSISHEQLATLRDIVDVLELRIGVETEAAGLAAERRGPENLAALEEALRDFEQALREGGDAVRADYRFHLEVAQATQNRQYTGLLATLGASIIPRSRTEPVQWDEDERLRYLQQVNTEHRKVYEAITRRDAEAARDAMRQHLVNSRERRRRLFGASGPERG